MRFLIDGMLGRLARWLRLIGQDVEYLPDVSDIDLIEKSVQESRVLLTSDLALYRAAVSKGLESLLVKGRNEAERLAQVAKRFDLKLEVDTITSRCPSCGSSIRPLPKREARGKVPSTTFKAYDDFWVCLNRSCGKIYWQGSHWKKISEVLKEANQLLKRRR